MANIDQYIEQIANARYGKDVRQSIINALTAMNNEIKTSGVQSFNDRIGRVVPAKDDYNMNQISSEGGRFGQVPVVNNHGGFTMMNVPGEIGALNDLIDVNISRLEDAEVLTYKASTENWVNKPIYAVHDFQMQNTSGETFLAFFKRVAKAFEDFIDDELALESPFVCMEYNSGIYACTDILHKRFFKADYHDSYRMIFFGFDRATSGNFFTTYDMRDASVTETDMSQAITGTMTLDFYFVAK